MANYFVDSTTGDNGDDGTTMDLAWATIQYAMESGGLTAGDVVWVRRGHSETPGDTIDSNYDGTVDAPIKVIGWPRTTTSIQATWNNGSTTVDNVTGATLSTLAHVGRYLSGPDGFQYLITKIVDTDTLIIDREYSGSTSPSGSGTIHADEDYATAQAIDDSGWTITKTDWNTDADTLAVIDFNDTTFQWDFNSAAYHCIYNLGFLNSKNGNGMLFPRNTCRIIFIRGCYFDLTGVTGNSTGLQVTVVSLVLERSIFVGTNDGGYSCSLLYANRGFCWIKDCAFYGSDYYNVLISYSFAYLENVNIGVEAAGDTYDMLVQYHSEIKGRDVKIGSSGISVFWPAHLYPMIKIENYGKILGAHFSQSPHGTVIKLDVVAGSGDPQKRSTGSDSVIEVAYNQNDANSLYGQGDREKVDIFTHDFDASTDSRRYRYYVQAEGAVSASQLWIEVEYVAKYDDDSEYVIKKEVSTQSISVRADESDWSQYIQVDDITPAVASRVRIKCYCSYYDATNKIYVDPKPEIVL